MDKEEAIDVVRRELEKHRKKSYKELREFLNNPTTYEVESASSKTYQIEIQVFPDDSESSDLRVIGVVGDGGWRAFFPLSPTLRGLHNVP